MPLLEFDYREGSNKEALQELQFQKVKHHNSRHHSQLKTFYFLNFLVHTISMVNQYFQHTFIVFHSSQLLNRNPYNIIVIRFT